MTYMRPNYLPVRVPHSEWKTRQAYSLKLYREGKDPASSINEVDGIPVLFIPGNAGDYKQVRSLGVQTFEDWNGQQKLQSPQQTAQRLDLWSVDFAEELSALSGNTLRAQTNFVCRVIPFILSKYSKARGGGGSERKLLLVGHSMGGLVARLALSESACTLNDVRVLGIVTITTPHLRLPAVVDPVMRSLVDQSARDWRRALFRNETAAADFLVTNEGALGPNRPGSSGHHPAKPRAAGLSSPAVMINVVGGPRDVLVGDELGDVRDVCPPRRCFALSSSSLDGAWLSVDHQAAVWCNQIVRKLSQALQALAVDDVDDDSSAAWPLTHGPPRVPDRMQRVQSVLLRGPLALEAISVMGRHPLEAEGLLPLHPQLLPNLTPDPLPAWKVELVTDQHRSRSMRVPALEHSTHYLWQVPLLPSADGVGPNVVVSSNLPLAAGWRLVLCSALHDFTKAAPDAVAATCLRSKKADSEEDLWSAVSTARGGTEVTAMAVPFELQECKRRNNADCVQEKPGVGIQWLLTLPARILRPGQFLCFVSPETLPTRGPERTFWLTASTLVPPARAEDFVKWLAVSGELNPVRTGGTYLPMVTLPGSLSPLPASMTIHLESCSDHGKPLHEPIVLQSPAMHWQDGLSEGAAASAVPAGRSHPLWRHQRIPPAIARWKPTVAVIVDPACKYQASITVDVLSMLGEGMRRHAVRIFALTAGTLCFASAMNNGPPSSAPFGIGLGISLSVLVSLLLQPIAYCLLVAECARCRSVWGCVIGTAVVQDMPEHARSTAESALPVQIEWSHRESLVLPLVITLGAAGLAMVLCAFCSAASSLVSRFSPLPRPLSVFQAIGMAAGAGTLGLVHPALGGAAALMLLLSPPVHAMGSAATHAQVLVLLGVLSRGPHLVCTVKNLVTAVTAGDSAFAVWSDEVWGSGSAGWRGTVDQVVCLSFPLLAAMARFLSSRRVALAETQPVLAPAARRYLAKAGLLLSGLGAICAAQVDIYVLSWVAYAVTAVLCLGGQTLLCTPATKKEE